MVKVNYKYYANTNTTPNVLFNSLGTFNALKQSIVKYKFSITNRIFVPSPVNMLLGQYKGFLIHDNEFDLHLYYCLNCKQVVNPKFVVTETDEFGDIKYNTMFNPLSMISHIECPHCKTVVPYSYVASCTGRYLSKIDMVDNKEKGTVSIVISYGNVTHFKNKVQVKYGYKRLVFNTRTRNVYLVASNIHGKKTVRNINFNSKVIKDFFDFDITMVVDHFIDYANYIIDNYVVKTKYVEHLKSDIKSFVDLSDFTSRKLDLIKHNIFVIYSHLLSLFRLPYVSFPKASMLNSISPNLVGKLSKMSYFEAQNYMASKVKNYPKRIRKLILSNLMLYPIYNKIKDKISNESVVSILTYISNNDIYTDKSYINNLFEIFDEYSDFIKLLGEKKTVESICDYSLILLYDAFVLIKNILSIDNDITKIKHLLKGDIKGIHDALNDHLTRIRAIASNVSISYSPREMLLENTIDNYNFMLPKDTYTLIDIGKKMNICVGNLYTSKALSKRCTIVAVIKDDKYVGCIEVINDSIVQAKGNSNHHLPKSVEIAIIKWAQLNKLAINTQDINITNAGSVFFSDELADQVLAV